MSKIYFQKCQKYIFKNVKTYFFLNFIYVKIKFRHCNAKFIDFSSVLGKHSGPVDGQSHGFDELGSLVVLVVAVACHLPAAAVQDGSISPSENIPDAYSLPASIPTTFYLATFIIITS